MSTLLYFANNFLNISYYPFQATSCYGIHHPSSSIHILSNRNYLSFFTIVSSTIATNGRGQDPTIPKYSTKEHGKIPCHYVFPSTRSKQHRIICPPQRPLQDKVLPIVENFVRLQFSIILLNYKSLKHVFGSHRGGKT